MRHNRLISLCAILVMALTACTHSPTRSFYFWKTTFALSATEKNTLAALNINRLYIRFFDVDWDAAGNQAVPVGKIRFRDVVPAKVTVVPTVYLVNRTLQNTSPNDIQALSVRIMELINGIARLNHIAFTEIQLDCDWTETSREKYFSLLQHLGKTLHQQNKTLSATIRLHQIKYPQITGIPPVNRGMLMYYNMGKIDATTTRNSIYNATDAGKYANYIASYPLPLDVALPAFSWAIHIRSNRVIELLNNTSDTDFKNNDNFARSGPNVFRAKYPFFYKGFYFMKDDVVKVEEVSPQLCKEATRQVSEKMKNKPAVVAMYHLDSTILSHYETKDFDEVFGAFR